jgi:hypothetical protein
MLLQPRPQHHILVTACICRAPYSLRITGLHACEHTALLMQLGVKANQTPKAQSAVPVHCLACQQVQHVRSRTSTSFRQHAVPQRDERRRRHAATLVQSFTAGSAVVADTSAPAHTPNEPQVYVL